ncbi:DNRLRE domain-containing protein [Nocardioides ochotonae]|uniref:DNRLRE domain-containing protein n=1 Tax=Nocardioides ochotonae TaxID=2685869 RepID=UPI00140C7FF8|nr:DNRLRE domain-containing protein [Nocardioides ochotonae]
MSSVTVRSGFDTHAAKRKEGRNFAGAKSLELRPAEAVGFVYFRSPVPQGATVTKATLRVYARGASKGPSRTVSVHRVSESWKQRQVTWNRRPDVTGSPAVSTALGNLRDGRAITVDVTSIVQAWANGAPNYGVRLSLSAVDDADRLLRLYSFNTGKRPTLEVSWSDRPATPTDLRPAGGIVSTTHPTLRFDYLDVGGNTRLSAVQVEIRDPDTGDTWTSPVTETRAAELDLSETDFGGFGSTGLEWRVRARDGAGLWSTNWSDWSDEVTYEALTPPTIISPADGVVWETTPPIVWEPHDGQVRYQVIVRDEGGDKVYDSGEIPSDDVVHNIRTPLSDDQTYRVVVRVWDARLRVETPGAPAHASSPAVSFAVQVDDTIPAPTDLTCAPPYRGAPYVELRWTRPDTPDNWTIYRDGRALAVEVLPEETIQDDGATFVWRDYSAQPHTAHRYYVRPNVNNRLGNRSAVVTTTMGTEGLWLVNTETGASVCLFGDDDGSWSMPEESSVYTPVGGSRPIRIVSAMRGLEGNLSGDLMDGFGRTCAEWQADLMAIKGDPTAVLRLVAGDVNIPVLVGNIAMSPSPKSRAGQSLMSVTFDFWQTGELPFKIK